MTQAAAWAVRGITTNFADDNADYTIYRSIFREVLEHAPCITRNLALAEIFAGAAGITACMTSLGYKAFAYERKHGDTFQDVCTIGGTFFLYYLVSAVAVSGYRNNWASFAQRGRRHPPPRRARGELGCISHVARALQPYNHSPMYDFGRSTHIDAH
eukprot:3126418-Pyramimonas_sp.AAC.1